MWDFSTAGWQKAARDFVASLIKTALVAVAAYVAMRLANVSIDPMARNAELFTGLVVVGRALLSSFLSWANTLPGETSAQG